MNDDDNTRIGNPNRGASRDSYVAERGYASLEDGTMAAQMNHGSANGARPGKRLNIGQAIIAAKSGARIARKGWNGSGQYVYYIPAASYPAQTPSARDEFGHMVPYREYLALKTSQDDVATWAPSCSDTLATDWYIV